MRVLGLVVVGFVPRFVYTAALQGFSAELTREVVAAVRCEPTVHYIEYDGLVHADGRVS